MKKIGNWDDIQEAKPTGESIDLPIGAYVCKIVEVKDIVEKEYLEIHFDIIQGEHTGVMQKSYAQYGEWPNLGILRKSYKDTALTFFKAFVTAVKKSNERFVWNFDEQALVAQQLVVVFGQEEYDPVGHNEADDFILVVKPLDVRSVQALRDGKIKPLPVRRIKGGSSGSSEQPEPKKNPEQPKPPTNQTGGNNNNFNVVDDDLPF